MPIKRVQIHDIKPRIYLTISASDWRVSFFSFALSRLKHLH